MTSFLDFFRPPLFTLYTCTMHYPLRSCLVLPGLRLRSSHLAPDARRCASLQCVFWQIAPCIDGCVYNSFLYAYPFGLCFITGVNASARTNLHGLFAHPLHTTPFSGARFLIHTHPSLDCPLFTCVTLSAFVLCFMPHRSISSSSPHCSSILLHAIAFVRLCFCSSRPLLTSNLHVSFERFTHPSYSLPSSTTATDACPCSPLTSVGFSAHRLSNFVPWRFLAFSCSVSHVDRPSLFAHHVYITAPDPLLCTTCSLARLVSASSALCTVSSISEPTTAERGPFSLAHVLPSLSAPLISAFPHAFDLLCNPSPPVFRKASDVACSLFVSEFPVLSVSLVLHHHLGHRASPYLIISFFRVTPTTASSEAPTFALAH